NCNETRSSWMIDIAGTRNLSPIQSGCYKPPVACGFRNRNAAFWIEPSPAVHDLEHNRDCFAWSNNQDALCFNYNSCKAGVLMDITIEWSFLAIIINFFLFLIHFSACCALITKLSEHESQIDSFV
ncbi:hypothetical protein CUMW_271540, partial [Citrus unshiu]